MSTAGENRIVFGGKPPHEVLVDLVNTANVYGMPMVAEFVERCTILAGHDEIITAVDKRRVDNPHLEEFLERIRVAVEAQKAEAETRKKAEVEQATDIDRINALKMLVQMVVRIVERDGAIVKAMRPLFDDACAKVIVRVICAQQKTRVAESSWKDFFHAFFTS